MIKHIYGIIIILCLAFAVTQVPKIAIDYLDIYNAINETTSKGLYDTQKEANQPH